MVHGKGSMLEKGVHLFMNSLQKKGFLEKELIPQKWVDHQIQKWVSNWKLK
jgi:hypothetical protein